MIVISIVNSQIGYGVVEHYSATSEALKQGPPATLFNKGLQRRPLKNASSAARCKKPPATPFEKTGIMQFIVMVNPKTNKNSRYPMYHNYFGLNEQAFSIAVNPRYLYMSQQHKEALAHLLYGVKGGGFVLLSGEVGTGKTTIIKCLLQKLPKHTDIAIVLNPMAGVTDMLCTVCEELGAHYDKSNINAKSLNDALYQYLLENHKKGHNTVLLIDEAQLLSPEALEQLRLLTNLETTTQKLLQIILVGQPEINDLLSQPRMRQLSQRITARFHLTPLNLHETEVYITHRLHIAGLPKGRDPYPPAIIKKIHKFTGGIPRLINIICERMLIGAYGHNKPVVDAHIYKLACKEVAGSMEHLPNKFSPSKNLLIASTSGAVAILAAVIIWLFAGSGDSNTVDVSSENIPPQNHISNSLVDISDTTGDLSAPQTQISKQPAHSNPERNKADNYKITSYSEAQFKLFSYLGFSPSIDSHPCWEFASKQIQCKNITLNTWDALRDVNRPAILVLTTSERFTSHVIVIGLGRRSAQVITNNGKTRQIPLADLGPLWTGKIFYAWTKPDGFTEPLVKGMRGRTVKWVAEQFALIDKQPPLAASRFTPLLEKRVKIFQRVHGLNDDGIIGEQTLMKINEVLGIDKPLNIIDDA